MYQTLNAYTPTKESKLVTLGFVSEATEEFGLMGVMRLFFRPVQITVRPELQGCSITMVSILHKLLKGSITK